MAIGQVHLISSVPEREHWSFQPWLDTDTLLTMIPLTRAKLNLVLQGSSVNLGREFQPKTPVTHGRMFRRIAAGYLIWKMLSDLQIIFSVRKGIRNVLVRPVTACCNPCQSLAACLKSDKIPRPLRKNQTCVFFFGKSVRTRCPWFFRISSVAHPWVSLLSLYLSWCPCGIPFIRDASVPTNITQNIARSNWICYGSATDWYGKKQSKGSATDLLQIDTERNSQQGHRRRSVADPWQICKSFTWSTLIRVSFHIWNRSLYLWGIHESVTGPLE